MLLLQILLLCFVGALLGEEQEDRKYLSLQAYLDKVKKNNDGYKAACLAQEGYLQESKAIKLMYLPVLNTSSFYNFDNATRITPLLQGSNNVFWTTQVSLQERLNTGLDLQVNMLFNHSQYNDVNPLFFPITDFFSFANSAQVTQHILKNSFGRQYRAREDSYRYDLESRSYQCAMNIAQLLKNAESVYWQYAISNKKLKVRKESICFQTFVSQFAKKRFHQELFPSSEVFRTRALLERDKLEYQNELLQNALYERQFYALIEDVNQRKEQYALEDVTYDTILNIALPKKGEWDDDLRYQYSMMKKNDAEARREQQETLPVLDFNFTGSMTGLEEQEGQAYSNAWSFKNATYKVELVFSIPLAYGINIETYKSLKRQARAAKFNYQWSHYKRDQNWDALLEKYETLLRMASTGQELEEIQREGYVNEKERFYLGSSSTFYVGSFYENYVKASIACLDIYLQILQTLTEMNTYHESSKDCPL